MVIFPLTIFDSLCAADLTTGNYLTLQGVYAILGPIIPSFTLFIHIPPSSFPPVNFHQGAIHSSHLQGLGVPVSCSAAVVGC